MKLRAINAQEIKRVDAFLERITALEDECSIHIATVGDIMPGGGRLYGLILFCEETGEPLSVPAVPIKWSLEDRKYVVDFSQINPFKSKGGGK